MELNNIDTSMIRSEIDKKISKIQGTTIAASSLTLLATGFGVGYFAKSSLNKAVLIGIAGVVAVLGIISFSDMKTWNALAPKDKEGEEEIVDSENDNLEPNGQQ